VDAPRLMGAPIGTLLGCRPPSHHFAFVAGDEKNLRRCRRSLLGSLEKSLAAPEGETLQVGTVIAASSPRNCMALSCQPGLESGSFSAMARGAVRNRF